METNQTAIERAVAILGGRTETKEAIGVSQPTVSNWLRGVHGVAAAHAIRIERATNGAVTRYELRPDVFGDQAA